MARSRATIHPPASQANRRPSRVILRPIGRGFLGRWLGKKRYLLPDPSYRVVETHNCLMPPVGQILSQMQVEFMMEQAEHHVLVIQ